MNKMNDCIDEEVGSVPHVLACGLACASICALTGGWVGGFAWVANEA